MRKGSGSCESHAREVCRQTQVQALGKVSTEGAGWRGDHRAGMGCAMDDVMLRRFEAPDEIREFAKGQFEVVRIGGLTIGRATYQPGWKWSVDVGPTVGATRCNVEHIGLVVSGAAVVAFDDGRIIELAAGNLFYISATPHDSWVVGDRPYVSLHFMGADHYARHS